MLDGSKADPKPGTISTKFNKPGTRRGVAFASLPVEAAISGPTCQPEMTALLDLYHLSLPGCARRDFRRITSAHTYIICFIVSEKYPVPTADIRLIVLNLQVQLGFKAFVRLPGRKGAWLSVIMRRGRGHVRHKIEFGNSAEHNRYIGDLPTPFQHKTMPPSGPSEGILHTFIEARGYCALH